MPTSSKSTKKAKTKSIPILPQTTRWLNNKHRVWKAGKIARPCHACGYCPYGQLVEEFPCHQEEADYAAKHNKYVKMNYENGKPNGWIDCKKNDPDPTTMPDVEYGIQHMRPKNKYSCKVFGHDCPVYYHAEPFAEN